MFKKVSNIKKFGIYQDFEWDKVLKASEFKKLNIIYGRNYSGKTTLSRVMRSFEKKEIHPHYPEGTFELLLSSSEVVSHKFETATPMVRVFNKDYVSENLKVLFDNNGEIKPFAILGEKNIETEAKIEKIDKQLGSESIENTEKFKQAAALKEWTASSSKSTKLDKEIGDKLQDKAREIREDGVFKNVNYKAPQLKEDIKEVKSKSIKKISDEEISKKRLSLKEESKSDIKIATLPQLNFIARQDAVSKLLVKKVSPTKAIEELIANPQLQDWVRHGILHHKEKRTQCAFCDSQIQESVWERLNAHFDKSSEELRNDLLLESENIKQNIESLSKFELPKKSEFYGVFQDAFEKEKEAFNKAMKLYLSKLTLLQDALEEKGKNIFGDFEPLLFESNEEELNNLYKTISEICKKNAEKTKTLQADQKNIINEIRLQVVVRFINDYGYDSKTLESDNLKQEVAQKKETFDSFTRIISDLEAQKKALQSELKDEKKGALKVNDYLKNFFGHEFLSLEAEEGEEKKIFFKIKRNGEDAKNLSEGESSLIAFCYFIARLSDIDTLDKEPIVWIDDPISSLDNNHIYFMFSLLESELAKPQETQHGNKFKYTQLFVSTHNLDFLKYLKKLSCPKIKTPEKDIPDLGYFMIERNGDVSNLQVMPNHLKNYVTEFNYLFHQIYKCSSSVNDDGENEKFYSFGNNLRKFLEVFLYYRYPGPGDQTFKIRKFFGQDVMSETIVHRVTNEMSHLEGFLERGAIPIEIPEMKKLADFVLNKIESKDPEQYAELKKSVKV